MKKKIENPKVFISYAWGSDEYQNKVLAFVTQLRSDGIDTVFDKWDLIEGNNTYYVFCDTIYTSGFSYHIESGNVNLCISWINNLYILRTSIGRNRELAKLIFSRNNEKLYDIIEDRFTLSIEIIDKYIK